MNKKTMLIGLGVLAVAGIGYYMWKKKSETKSGACGCSGADGEDDSYSNVIKGGRPKGTKKCDCGFAHKLPKICSKDVGCNDCCLGAGTGGHTGMVGVGTGGKKLTVSTL
jgi:hypothetical protein